MKVKWKAGSKYSNRNIQHSFTLSKQHLWLVFSMFRCGKLPSYLNFIVGDKTCNILSILVASVWWSPYYILYKYHGKQLFKISGSIFKNLFQLIRWNSLILLLIVLIWIIQMTKAIPKFRFHKIFSLKYSIFWRNTIWYWWMCEVFLIDL